MLEKDLEDSAGNGDAATRVAEPAAHGAKFERRRHDIIAAAIPILNSQGFKGMRLTAVAEAIGLRATGVTYYFPRKEELAVACMETGLAIFHELLDIAERETTGRARIARFIELFVQRQAEVRMGGAIPLSSFSSLRSLEGVHFERVYGSYRDMFRRVRALFGAPDLPPLHTTGRAVRALILLEQLFWAEAWLADCDIEDYPRAITRMTDTMLHGLAAPGAGFAPRPLGLEANHPGIDPAKEAFLIAATRQINDHGYRGASVDRIAASINLTKGAFYHHNDAKDDVVAACFRRTFGVMSTSRRLVRGMDAPEWERLVTGIMALVRFQVGEHGPLLRTGVLYSMPQEQRPDILAAYARIERTIAGMIADALAEGAVRPIDPTIAAHLVVAGLNAAADLRHWDRIDLASAADDYCRALLLGLLAP